MSHTLIARVHPCIANTHLLLLEDYCINCGTLIYWYIDVDSVGTDTTIFCFAGAAVCVLDLLGTWLASAACHGEAGSSQEHPTRSSDNRRSLGKNMVQHETRDLHKLLLKPLQDLSWSSAPATHMAKMLELADLWEGFIGKAPNGVLPPAATKKGIEGCNAQGLINFTRMTSSNFADQVSVVIRQALSKLREVKDSAKILNATERKLGQSCQILKLRKLLDMML